MLNIARNNTVTIDRKDIVSELRDCLIETQVKQRVLSIITRFEQEYWLQGLIQKYQKSINISTHWFDSLTFLNWYAYNFKPANYLEIGVGWGRSMAQVLIESPQTKAYGFDLWVRSYGSIPEKGIHISNPGPEFVIKQLRNLGVTNVPVLIQGDSHERIPRFLKDAGNPQQFELIFVDGDKSYDGARGDLQIVSSHIAPGGVLVFNDINFGPDKKLLKLWNEVKSKYPDFLFIEEKNGSGMAAAFKPPLSSIQKHLEIKRSETICPNLSWTTDNTMPVTKMSRDYQFDSEIREQQLVKRIVKAGMTVFDIGAHLGGYTKLLSILAGEKGRVYAFEPTPNSFEKLTLIIKKTNCSNVTLIKKAVYSKNHKVIINEFPPEYSAWNSLGSPDMKAPHDPMITVPIEKSTEVEAVTLDSFCRQHNIQKIDYLKVDVEGCELEVLIGATSLLENKAVCFLQFEISKKMLDGLNTKAGFIFDFLKSKGYECHTVNQDGTFGEKVSDSDSSYENYIAFPSSPASVQTDTETQISNPKTRHERGFVMENIITGTPTINQNIVPQTNIPMNNNTVKTTAPPNSMNSKERHMHGNFTDGDLWTPETYMRRAIMDWLNKTSFVPGIALSIDKNPPLDVIILRRWPDLTIHRAVYPEFDSQDLSRIPDNQYDLVYSNQILEHIPKPWLAGKEMVRVLKPGGLGLHTTCAFNPRHGPPVFNDYFRFLPDGLAELFEGVKVLVKAGWGNRQALLYNIGVDDGHGVLGGRRFCEQVGQRNEEQYPWHVWIIFEKVSEMNINKIGEGTLQWDGSQKF